MNFIVGGYFKDHHNVWSNEYLLVQFSDYCMWTSDPQHAEIFNLDRAIENLYLMRAFGPRRRVWDARTMTDVTILFEIMCE